MNYKLTEQEYKRISELTDKALEALRKKDAEPYLHDIESMASSFIGAAGIVIMELCAGIRSVINEKSYSEKERKKKFCKMDLSKLAEFVE